MLLNVQSVPKKWWLVFFFLDKKLKIPIYGNFDARSPNSGSKTMPDHYFTQNSRKYSIADFPILEDLCGFKKTVISMDIQSEFWETTQICKNMKNGENVLSYIVFEGKYQILCLGQFSPLFKWLFITTTFENSNRKINII